jgi:hypothetical protein
MRRVFRQRGSLGISVSLGCFLCGFASSCGSTPAPGPVLQPSDLVPTPGAKFDPNEIIPYPGFVDSLSISPQEIQGFLAMNPYGTTSFLATYQSSGILAADSIAAAATTYRINPIVLLVRAEIEGGLIGAQTYPLPSQEVEYLFGCGCTSPTTCDPAFAGLDKQFDCLGSALRLSLDQIAANGETAGGWAPMRSAVTLDGVKVTPVDASTAALYQYDPVVGQGKSDNWLVWNLWELYTTFLSYIPPVDPAGDATAEVGDPCRQASDCAFGNPLCETEYPGGLCTTTCSGSCEGIGAFCADFQKSGYCLAVCNPTDPASCRAGYSCILTQQYMSSGPIASNNVCFPM